MIDIHQHPLPRIIGEHECSPSFANRKTPDDMGQHYDTDKLPVELYPIEALVRTTKVLQHGTKKYDRRNWEKGIIFSKIYASTLRHLFAWWCGKDLDPESKLNHLDHAACNIAFLQTYVDRKMHRLDDRPAKAAEDLECTFLK